MDDLIQRFIVNITLQFKIYFNTLCLFLTKLISIECYAYNISVSLASRLLQDAIRNERVFVNSRLGSKLATIIRKRLTFDYLGVKDNSTMKRLFTVQRYPRVVLVIMHEIVLLLRGHAWPSFIRLFSSSLAETLCQILSLDTIVSFGTLKMFI